jgi:CheY-like chemotaxis protein
MIGACGGRLDGVLLDVTLPGKSSREVLEDARRVHPGLRVILTSAYSKATIDAAFAGLQVDHFIRKPFVLGDLFNVLRTALAS